MTTIKMLEVIYYPFAQAGCKTCGKKCLKCVIILVFVVMTSRPQRASAASPPEAGSCGVAARNLEFVGGKH